MSTYIEATCEYWSSFLNEPVFVLNESSGNWTPTEESWCVLEDTVGDTASKANRCAFYTEPGESPDYLPVLWGTTDDDPYQPPYVYPIWVWRTAYDITAVTASGYENAINLAIGLVYYYAPYYDDVWQLKMGIINAQGYRCRVWTEWA